MSGVAVAVDGGQSGIRMRVGGHEGVLRAEGLGRLEEQVAGGLLRRIRVCLAELPTAAPVIERMTLGLTVVPADEEARVALARELATVLGIARVDIAGDELTAHAGAFGGGAGVVLTVGTGIACLGLDPATGAFRRVDGDGFLLGDAGSGFWLGSRGVEAVLRARDGRGAATALEAACDARYGAHPDLAAWLHGRRRAVAEIARFAIDVQEAAGEGDPVAAELVAAAAEELVATAGAAAAALDAHPCPLALSGRVVSPGSALRAALEARLAGDGALVCVAAQGDPLDGAWAIAEGRLGEAYSDHLSTWILNSESLNSGRLT